MPFFANSLFRVENSLALHPLQTTLRPASPRAVCLSNLPQLGNTAITLHTLPRRKFHGFESTMMGRGTHSLAAAPRGDYDLSVADEKHAGLVPRIRLSIYGLAVPHQLLAQPQHQLTQHGGWVTPEHGHKAADPPLHMHTHVNSQRLWQSGKHLRGGQSRDGCHGVISVMVQYRQTTSMGLKIFTLSKWVGQYLFLN